ncbi:Telomere repeat-binding factor 3 [Spatholobus suberectus]|nr:Telomere repeat-binding factor 3 [Spatholobus suberectus]
MRRKSGGKRRPAASATVTPPPLSAIPLLSDEHNAIAYDTEGDDDVDCLHRRPEPVDLLAKSICICCDNKGEEEGVLVCSERGCPVTVHANCIGSEPKFDDSGNFYCPYCWYKRATDTCQQLREKVLVAKNALSRFLDDDTRADSAAARVNPVQDRQECAEKAESEEKKDEGKVSASVTGSSVSESESEGVSVKKRKDQKKVASAKKSLLQKEHVSEENKDEGKVSASVTGSSVSESKSEGVSGKRRKDQKKVASARKPLSQQEHKQYNTRGKIANEEEVTSFQTLRQPQRSPAKVMKRTLLTAKRRRLLWTAEEEKVLKEGVLKFSTENQNIPWRKILEFGCRVFDKTRTPVDLKDKWKNISKDVNRTRAWRSF